MKRLPLLIGALAALAIPAFAAEDPIAVRQALMSNNGGAAGVSGAIMKDELAYAPVVGKAALLAFSATAQAYGDFFPEGTLDPARSAASPKIWEDMAGFQAELAKFQAAAAAGVEAAGRDGPADKAAFAAAVQPILQSCQSCHEGYRTEN
jgi:cytochrome c556